MLEEKWGVSAAAPVAVAATGAGDAGAAEEEKTEFDVVLVESGTNKISVIKAVRSSLGLGLKEAKDAVQGVPFTVKKSITKNEAQELQKQLETAGAKVEIR
jgi:large subunit ribosomal protein L7/L12